MTEKNRNCLLQAGIDLDSALSRFLNNEDAYIRFLNKFLNENLYPNMEEEIRQRDVKKAFAAAHTMKGVCLNLSIISMCRPLNEIVEILRRDSFDGVEEYLFLLRQAYDQVVAAVDTLNNGAE